MKVNSNLKTTAGDNSNEQAKNMPFVIELLVEETWKNTLSAWDGFFQRNAVV